ncbi:hypothetical protein [Cellulomonas sp. URHD0024]|uniref:hypothetical protein n=1 Tax=Cellulomonas sp. URHD0024 TaxID=1302620 RepID=UPI0004201A86|nr:hypothetical protein [Cellulomonas sp. URHD0024]
MTMKTTWTLAVSAVTALSVGTAIAAATASAAAPEAPARPADVVTPAAQRISLADVPLPPAVGDTVPAFAVEATREAGASVFVSPSGDGSGLVIDPAAPLPDAVVAEIDAVNRPTSDLGAATAQLAARTAVRDALDEADTSVLVLSATPTFDADGAVTGALYGIVGNHDAPLEFATSHGLRATPFHDRTVASWRRFMTENPQYRLVDTTTLW